MSGIPGKVTDTSLTLDTGLSITEWAAALELIGTFHRGSPWWIGDALCYGEDRFGEKYAQYVEETGLSVKTLLERARISRSIPPERRREDLSLSHHAAVAGLLPAQQMHLLALAASQGWDTATLRAEARRLDTRPKPLNHRPSLGELGDALAADAALFLQALEAPGDETAGAAARTALITAIAAWQNRREP
jgi:hypothetical protein